MRKNGRFCHAHFSWGYLNTFRTKYCLDIINLIPQINIIKENLTIAS